MEGLLGSLAFLLISGLVAGVVYLGCFTTDSVLLKFVGAGTLMLWGAVVAFYPIFYAGNFASRVSGLDEVLTQRPELREIAVRHQYYVVIVILTVIGWGTGICYLIAFIWAHAPGEVTVPEKLVQALKEGRDAPPSVQPVLNSATS